MIKRDFLKVRIIFSPSQKSIIERKRGRKYQILEGVNSRFESELPTGRDLAARPGPEKYINFPARNNSKKKKIFCAIYEKVKRK